MKKVMVRCFSVCLLAMVVGPGVAVAQDDPPSRLPIEVPKHADISFEADGEGKDFVPIIKRYLASEGSEPAQQKVSVSTPFGNIDLSIDDLKPLIKQIHHLHIVVYTGGGKEDPFKVQEKHLQDAGLKKVVMAPGSDGPLVMRKSSGSEQYGIVTRMKGSVVVLRSEGGPNLGDFGRIAYQTLAQLVQQSANAKRGR